MARITARQAFTRAKSKRSKDRSASDRALLEARRRYIRQLGQVGIDVEGASQSQTQQAEPEPKSTTTTRTGIRKRSSPARNAATTNSKKITDYFAVTKNLDLIARVRKPMAKITSTRDQNGIEVITIDELEPDIPDSNNNHDNIENNISLESLNSSDWSTSSNGSTPGSSKNGEIKPLRCKLDVSNLGKSFEELQLKVHIDEDIEIVDMLPPIPLRNHPVFDIDEI